ncbi:hypothetical protein [Bacillus cereus]|nr:hypothetical protein [Bacillus cereus]
MFGNKENEIKEYLIGVPPHRYQAKVLKYPQTKKTSCFLSKIHGIFILGV